MALIKTIFKSLIGISIVLVLSIVASFVLFGMDSSNSETNNVEIDDAGLEASLKETPIEPSTNDQDSPSTSTWQDVVSWEGKGIKNTETFHISSNVWHISWDTKPGQYGEMNFQIYVFDADGELIDIVANVIGEDSDNSIMRGSGDYYLKINTGQPYEVIVAEKK